MRIVGTTCVALLCLASGCGVKAESSSTHDSATVAASGASVQDSIRALEQTWADAVRMRDSATLERLVGPDFTLATASDTSMHPVPRALWLQNTLQRLRVDSIRLTPAQVTARGDTATATLRFVWAGQFMQTPPFHDSTDLTDTWVRDAAGWRVQRRVVVR